MSPADGKTAPAAVTPSATAASWSDRMSKSASFELQSLGPGKYALRGALTFGSARRARALGLSTFHSAQGREFEIDCSGVTLADSAGLTVLIDWLAHAKRDDCRLRYARLPPKLMVLAKISDIDELIEKGV